jgi:hypothetical protein
MLTGEVAVDQKERVLRADVSVERQGACLPLQLGDVEERVRIDEASTAPRAKAAAASGARDKSARSKEASQFRAP